MTGHQQAWSLCNRASKISKGYAKPFIAICNSYINIVPGHVYLRELADIAKELFVRLVGFL